MNSKQALIILCTLLMVNITASGFGLKSWDGPAARLDQLTGISQWTFGQVVLPSVPTGVNFKGQWCFIVSSTKTVWEDDKVYVQPGHVPIVDGGPVCTPIGVSPWLEIDSRDRHADSGAFAQSSLRFEQDMPTFTIGMEDMANGDFDYNDWILIAQYKPGRPESR